MYVVWTQHCQSACPDFGALLGHSTRRSTLAETCLPWYENTSMNFGPERLLSETTQILHSSLILNVLVSQEKSS